MAYRYETSDKSVYKLLKQHAVRMRRYPTEEEQIMWDILCKNSFGVHFRRQHIILDYIADFICIKLKLIIEIDGGYHLLKEQIVKDTERSFWLSQQGYFILRFTNEELVADTDNVVMRIEQTVKSTYKDIYTKAPRPPKGEGMRLGFLERTACVLAVIVVERLYHLFNSCVLLILCACPPPLGVGGL